MTYYLKQKEVYKLLNFEDKEVFETKWQELYHVEKFVPCNALDTDSHSMLLVIQCRQALLLSSENKVSAYLHENYKIEYKNGRIKLFHIEKVLPKHTQ